MKGLKARPPSSERILLAMKASESLLLQRIEAKNKVTDFEVSYHANAIMGVIMEWYYQDFQQSVDVMNQLLLKVIKI
jgi:hypothetical protein